MGNKYIHIVIFYIWHNAIYLSLLGLLIALSSCQGLQKQQTLIQSYPPMAFSLQAKMSFISKSNNLFLNLNWQESKDNIDIKLTATNYLWELNINQTNNGTWINNELINTSLTQWLKQKYQFNLPIKALKNWVFLPKDINQINTQTVLGKLWEVQYLSHQLWQDKQNKNYKIAKKIRLKYDNTIITLLIKLK